MDDVLYKSLLYDYYGLLLTDKQREVFEMYYLNDMSLSEISENSGVSPQGISDMLKRSEKLLLKYEQKLGLIAVSGIVREKLSSALGCLENSASADEDNINTVKNLLREIMESV